MGQQRGIINKRSNCCIRESYIYIRIIDLFRNLNFKMNNKIMDTVNNEHVDTREGITISLKWNISTEVLTLVL